MQGSRRTYWYLFVCSSHPSNKTKALTIVNPIAEENSTRDRGPFFRISSVRYKFELQAQPNLMTEVLAAVTWLCPYLAQAVLIKPDQAVRLV
jgi:hypothetical protein